MQYSAVDQLLHHHAPDTEAEQRQWSARIIERCRAAEASLGDLFD
ncbi:hypothetical protein GCM10009718_23480 [Isoptericola halotolerans]|uniref:Uncharacterized protein n=1 Tax=Isoptericola halotolerans TaxID=300560 RepID=A0ABX2A5M6_9MICO|nr:hypothetical protein [Isoptericola halotolerans]NOV98089.1 hypothetical protein [Isoptericola halotolerans]